MVNSVWLLNVTCEGKCLRLQHTRADLQPLEALEKGQHASDSFLDGLNVLSQLSRVERVNENAFELI